MANDATLREKAREAISYPSECSHGEETWYCVCCRSEWSETLLSRVEDFARQVLEEAAEIAEYDAFDKGEEMHEYNQGWKAACMANAAAIRKLKV